MSGNEKKTKYILRSLGIGTILREIRNRRNLTLEEVSSATFIADETIRRIEKDMFEPKLSTLETLSDFYRVDLIELIARKRKSDSIFSDIIISKINDLINQQDFIELKNYADLLINTSLEGNYTLGTSLNSFLYSLKYIKYNPVNGQNDTIALLEDILIKTTPQNKSLHQLPYPIPFETSVILLLAIIYRQNHDYIKSINLLDSIIQRILEMPYINERFTNYLASAYINLAYTYHSKAEHKNVIEIVDICLSNIKINYTRVALSHLLFRKGLSMFILKKDKSESIIYTALTLMDDLTRTLIEEHLIDNYDLKIIITR